MPFPVELIFLGPFLHLIIVLIHLVHLVQYLNSFSQILTDAALLKRQKREIEELRAKLQVRPYLIYLFFFWKRSDYILWEAK